MANRLAQAKSLYLRQHAENPVDWYPWCPEAFARAQQEQKPIFLSIGYSACHWCHVMERESFSDPEVAQLLNEHFISIKVDREEHPDVDAFFMHVCQAMTGHGGWPLTILMTPDKRPFFAGTYFPKTDRFGRPGLMTLLREIVHLWQTRREELLQYAQELLDFLRQRQQRLAGVPSETILRHAFDQLSRSWDPRYGGFGGAPKFPMVPQLLFLLRWWYRSGDAHALEMVEHTLLHMRRGGIYDHVGFGFYRYATDERWHIPHFEKMLYDQAMALILYTEAHTIRPQPLWAQTVRETLEYCRRELLAPEGAFYTAEDADSAGEEGGFYLWSDWELRQLLTSEEYELLRRAFGIEPEGNVHGSGRIHLVQRVSWEALAEQLGSAPEELLARWEQIRQKLFAYRQRRVPPQRDEKILTDWNGLMVAALALVARHFGESSALELAQQAAAWFLHHWRQNGTLFHRYAEGEWAVPALLDDYSFLLWGMLELYQSTLHPEYLEAALQLGQTLRELFWDEHTRSFFLTEAHSHQLPLRPQDDADSAVPNGAALACWNFLRLSAITGEPRWHTWAEEALHSPPEPLLHAPMAFPTFLMALDMALGPTTQVFLVAPQPDGELEALVEEVQRHFLPRTLLIGALNERERLLQLAPAYASYPVLPRPAAYVCSDGSCHPPVHSAEELRALLPVRSP
jgi:uncharacterized protein YyaL (SSP411 family)